MSTAVATDQYLTFSIDGEQYGADVSRVREVLELVPITKIAQTHEFMKGVINIRNSVVPVIDLRIKLGLPEAEETVDTSIVVMDLVAESKTITIGCIVDSVQEVVHIDSAMAEPPPAIGSAIDGNSIRAIAEVGEKFVIILDIDEVFKGDQLRTAIPTEN